MSGYSLLVTLHVASVIIWVGCSTTLVFITMYAVRSLHGVLLDQLGTLTRWMTLWVLIPASLAAPGFGVLAAHAGHWPEIFFFHVGEGAFAFSFLLTVTIRLPLLRRARAGSVAPARLPRYLLALALAELTVLYLAVADMVSKPSGLGTGLVRYGAVVLALGFLAAAVIAVRARRRGAGREAGGSKIERVDFGAGPDSRAPSTRVASKP